MTSWTKLLRGIAFLFAAAWTVVTPPAALAQDRVALVIGNGAYVNAVQLINPPNDAADISAALRELGFDVIAATNVDKDTFDHKIREFAGKLRQARIALFYYAGHGMQVAGKNYALPIDAKLISAADLPVETVDIERVLSVMQADENRISLVFLDACRDNPLTRSFASVLPPTRALSVGNGLSAIEAGRGSLIAYSTAPNKVALDGKGRNSPFTTALLKYIRTPGLDIALILRRVTADVEAASGRSQIPWVHASLTTDVILNGFSKVAMPLVPSSGSVAPAPDELAWSLLGDTKDAELLRRFVREFPTSPRRTEAEARIASLAQPVNIGPKQVIEAITPSLPPDIPIDPNILRLVQNDPFFANAPSATVRSYQLNRKVNYSARGSTSTTTSSDERASIRSVIPGIIEQENVTQEVMSYSGGSSRGTRRTHDLVAINGLVGR